MFLFMIFAIPLSILFFFSLLKPGEALFFSASPAPGLSFFRGILFFIPALIVILFLKGLLPISYRSWRLYLFYLFEYHLLEFVLGVAGCFLLMHRHHEFIPVAFSWPVTIAHSACMTCLNFQPILICCLSFCCRPCVFLLCFLPRCCSDIIRRGTD